MAINLDFSLLDFLRWGGDFPRITKKGDDKLQNAAALGKNETTLLSFFWP